MSNLELYMKQKLKQNYRENPDRTKLLLKSESTQKEIMGQMDKVLKGEADFEILSELTERIQKSPLVKNIAEDVFETKLMLDDYHDSYVILKDFSNKQLELEENRFVPHFDRDILFVERARMKMELNERYSQKIDELQIPKGMIVVKSDGKYTFEGKTYNDELAIDSVERKILCKHLSIDEKELNLKQMFNSPEKNKEMDEKLFSGYIDKGSVFNEGADVFLYNESVINNNIFPEFEGQTADIYGNKTPEYLTYQKELGEFVDNIEESIIPDLEETFNVKEKLYTNYRINIDESLKLVDRCKNFEQLRIVKLKFDLETELPEIKKENEKQQDLSI